MQLFAIWTVYPPSKGVISLSLSLLLAGASTNTYFNLWRNDMSKNKTPMTSDAAVRIQRSTAKQNGGSVDKGSFAARATTAAAKNSPKQGGK